MFESKNRKFVQMTRAVFILVNAERRDPELHRSLREQLALDKGLLVYFLPYH